MPAAETKGMFTLYTFLICCLAEVTKYTCLRSNSLIPDCRFVIEAIRGYACVRAFEAVTAPVTCGATDKA